MNLLQMSVSGAVFIVAVMVIRTVANRHLPRRTFPVLWGMVLLRLLLPFSIPSVFSIYTFIGRSTVASVFPEAGAYNGLRAAASALAITDQGTVQETVQGTVRSIVESAVQSIGESTVQGVVQGTIQSAVQGREQLPAVSGSVPVWSAVWCVGAILLALFFAISYLRCCREFRTALPVRHACAERWLRDHPLRRRVTIRQSDRISTPLTYGVFRPVILMPTKTDWENTDSLQYIFMHEYVHICRFDTLTKLAATLVLCIHWFNPFVWLMYVFFNRDLELACDESVVRRFGEKARSAYSLVLISMEARKSGLPSLYSSFSKNVIEERITAIMHTKRITPGTVLSACLTVLVTASLFATSAAASTDGRPDQESAAIAPQTDAEVMAADEDVKDALSIIHESADILRYEDGAPYIHDILTNNTDRSIKETEYCMLAYDEKGAPLKLYWNFFDSSAESSFAHVVWSKENILAGQTEEYQGGWSLYDGERAEALSEAGDDGTGQAAYALFCLKQVVFEDGTVWNNPEYESWLTTYAGNVRDVVELQNYYPHVYRIKSDS